jgi:WD40 repeat protein
MRSISPTIQFMVCLTVIAFFSGQKTLQAQADPLEVSLGDSPVQDVVWHPDGSVLAVNVGEVVLLSPDLTELARPATQVGTVTDVAWNADGTLLAIVGDAAPRLELWRYDAAAQTLTFEEVILSNPTFYTGISAIAWSPDGRWMALQLEYDPPNSYIGGRPNRIEVWNTADWDDRTILYPYPHYVRSPATIITWTPDSESIVGGAYICYNRDTDSCGDFDADIYFADLITGQVTNDLVVGSYYGVSALEFSSTGELVVGANQLHVYDQTGGPLVTWNAHGSGSIGLVYASWQPNGTLLAVVARSESLLFWDWQTETIVLEIPSPIYAVYSLDWSIQNQLAIGDTGGNVAIVEVDAILPAP